MKIFPIDKKQFISTTVFSICLIKIAQCTLENGCDIPTDLRINVRDKNDDKSVCDTGSLCHETGYGCYLNALERPGFKIYKKDMDCDAGDISYGPSPSLEDCLNSCLLLSNCVAILIKNDNYCWTKNKCDTYSVLALHTAYHRLSDSRLSCFIGGMDGTVDTFYTHSQKEQAINSAILNNKVVIFTSTGISLKTGNLNNINKEYDKTTCFVGNLIVKEINGIKTFSTNHIMFDKQLATCDTVSNLPIKIRFPWPVPNAVKSNFVVQIDGENLNCYNPRISILGRTSILVYVPVDYQVDAEFEGNFLFCNLGSGNTTSCNYECNCNGTRCQAFYVNLQDNEGNMNICEITAIV